MLILTLFWKMQFFAVCLVKKDFVKQQNFWTFKRIQAHLFCYSHYSISWSLIRSLKFLHSNFSKINSRTNSSPSSDHKNYSIVEISEGWSIYDSLMVKSSNFSPFFDSFGDGTEKKTTQLKLLYKRFLEFQPFKI